MERHCSTELLPPAALRPGAIAGRRLFGEALRTRALRQAKPVARAVPVGCNGGATPGLRQPEQRHSTVEGLEFASSHEIGLMPDADVAAGVFHAAVEIPPRPPRGPVLSSRIALPAIQN